MEVEKIILNAFWLSEGQKRIIADAMSDPKLHNFSRMEILKLAGVLCAIPYGEDKLRIHGKHFLNKIEKILKRLHLIRVFCKSLGTWNLHTQHAKRFGYSVRKFSKLLQNDRMGIWFVIDLIKKDIGLGKPIDYIFAEYNQGIMATTVAALQRALNLLMKKYHFPFVIEEDGCIGEQTLAAIRKSNQFLLTPLKMQSFHESDILATLDRLNKEEGIGVLPFVPALQKRMDSRFLIRIIYKSLRRPLLLKKLPLVFHNHINVPLYVDSAMHAYQLVLREQ